MSGGCGDEMRTEIARRDPIEGLVDKFVGVHDKNAIVS